MDKNEFNTRKSEIYKRALNEYNTFIEELKDLSKEEIIEKAYEIVIKEEILLLLKVEDDFNDIELQYLENFEYPLYGIYIEWLDNDYSTIDFIRETIAKVSKEYA